MNRTTRMAPPGAWPFFAVSPADRLANALDLGEVGPGMRVCDLGSGDGTVLLAAAARGASVVGVERDRSLAERARHRLHAAGVPGEVVVGDVLTDPLPPADLYVAFLSPALLQRVVARPMFHTGVRARALVTVAYRVPGWVPNRSVGGSHRHDLPGLRRPFRPGWSAVGLAATLPAQARSLTYVLAGHPGGPVRVGLEGPATEGLTVVAGRDRLPGPGEVALDLRFDPSTDPSVRSGAVHLDGVGSLELLVSGASSAAWWALGRRRWVALRAAIDDAHHPIDLAAAVATLGPSTDVPGAPSA